MKEIVFSMAFVLLMVVVGHSQAEKNIVKSFRYEGTDLIELAMEGDVVVEEWDEKLVRMEVTVQAVNFNENLLKALLSAGRYSCETRDKDGVMVITMPKSHKELVLRGVKHEEKYQFKIYVPKNVTVEQVAYDEEVANLF